MAVTSPALHVLAAMTRALRVDDAGGRRQRQRERNEQSEELSSHGYNCVAFGVPSARSRQPRGTMQLSFARVEPIGAVGADRFRLGL